MFDPFQEIKRSWQIIEDDSKSKETLQKFTVKTTRRIKSLEAHIQTLTNDVSFESVLFEKFREKRKL
jgi:hypothetical protein